MNRKDVVQHRHQLTRGEVAEPQFALPETATADGGHDLLQEFGLIAGCEIVDDPGRTHGVQVPQSDELPAGFVDKEGVALEIGDANEFVRGPHNRGEHAHEAVLGISVAELASDRRKLF